MKTPLTIKKRLRLVVWIGLAAILAIIVLVEVNRQLDAWQNDAVRNYVARAVPVLDGIKKQSGSYPLTLPVSVLGDAPSLLKKYGEYESDGTQFRFEYVDEPTGWAGGEGALEFLSSDRQWKYDR